MLACACWGIEGKDMMCSRIERGVDRLPWSRRPTSLWRTRLKAFSTRNPANTRWRLALVHAGDGQDAGDVKPQNRQFVN